MVLVKGVHGTHGLTMKDLHAWIIGGSNEGGISLACWQKFLVCFYCTFHSILMFLTCLNLGRIVEISCSWIFFSFFNFFKKCLVCVVAVIDSRRKISDVDTIVK